MKDKLNKFLDPDISKEEQDEIFGEILKKKLDEDLKAKWQIKLLQEYGITRNKTNDKKKFSSSKYLKIFLAAAACISLIIVTQLFNTASSDPQTMAQQYLYEHEILHPGASKGFSDENQTRTLAILTFNNKNYLQSVRYFQNLETHTEEDVYYHGLALLLNNQYPEAIDKFKAVSINTDRYQQELNWYQSIAYLLDGQSNNAKIQLKQISNTDWNYKNAQRLLKELNEK
ncbi:hypothetical protein [uncultured Aquimarina sp.]|uniref:hypothetical protein n=1 Tax=uncultured Aquimarina sp. TaxID=575652 RepID=UPI0026269198|nr:hypothetical protein [uncultured Aquimarina sp.]